MDKWAELRAFVAVVEQEGFAPAARQLNMAPSGVSRLIGMLEARLGVRLLNRTTRKVGLTESGQRFYNRGRDVLRSFEEAEADATDLASEPGGHLQVSCVVTLAERWMPEVIAGFLNQYPRISLDLHETDRPIDLIGDGVDVALVAGQLDDSSYIARKLFEFSRVVVASPGYAKKHGLPAIPRDLKSHNCLAFLSAPHLQRWAFQTRPGNQTTVAVQGTFRAEGAETILRAALAGSGIARLASFMVAPYLKSGQLVEVLEEFRASEPVPLFAVYPSGIHLSPKIRVFMDHLATEFAERPQWEMTAAPEQA